MSVSHPRELEALRRVGAVVADAIQVMARCLCPGITTGELDRVAETVLEDAGARAAPRLTYGFPGVACISINDQVAHGVPGSRAIRDGDLVNLDVSAELDGYFADSGASFPVGKVDERSSRLCRAGQRALRAGLSQVRSRRRIAHIGRGVERSVKRSGFRVIRDLSGHGVGRSLHEEPSQVRNYYDPLDLRRMSRGLVFTIEPMISMSCERVVADQDGWTLRTRDRSRAVQYEHTVVVGNRGPIVMTVPSRAD